VGLCLVGATHLRRDPRRVPQLASATTNAKPRQLSALVHLSRVRTE